MRLSAPPRSPFNPIIVAAYGTMALERHTATLICESGDQKRLIFVRDGEIVGCRSSVRRERFGQLLLGQSFLTKAQLDTAVSYIRTGKKLGEIMVELGYFTSDELARFVSIQVRDVAAAMLFSDATRIAYSTTLEIDAVTPHPVAFVQVFDHAASRLERVGPFREMFERSPVARAGGGIPGEQRLDPETSAVWEVIDGRRTLRDLVRVSGLPEDNVVRTLVGLRAASLVELCGATSHEYDHDDDLGSDSASRGFALLDTVAGGRPKIEHLERRSDSDDAVESASANGETGSCPEPEADPKFLASLQRMKTAVLQGDHWSVLGLAPGASRAAILSAFHDLCSRFHPDVVRPTMQPGEVADLNFVFARIHEAYRVLSEEASARGYAELVRNQSVYAAASEGWERRPIEAAPVVTDPPTARRLYTMALQAYRRTDYWRTIQLSREALECGENEPDVYYLLGKALSHNPRWRRDAEKNLSIASKLDPWNPNYLVALGKLYRREGLVKRAEKMFSAARLVAPEIRLTDDA